jgi:hypothetical protein
MPVETYFSEAERTRNLLVSLDSKWEIDRYHDETELNDVWDQRTIHFDEEVNHSLISHNAIAFAWLEKFLDKQSGGK